MKNITDIKKSLEKIGLKSQNASKVLINLSTTQKNKALISIANEIKKDSKNILNNNKKDINNAKIKNLYVTICATCGPYSTEFATMQTTMQTPITTTVNILIFQPLQVGCGLILGPLKNAKHQSCRT